MIKVLRLGQPVVQLQRNGARTVNDVLASIYQTVNPGEELRLNNQPATKDSRLTGDDDSIMIVPAVKGGRA